MLRLRQILKFLIIICCYLPLQVVAQSVSLPATEQFTLKNKAGQDYQIMVSLPKNQTPAKPMPVLYILDGNSVFAAFHDAKRMESDYADTLIVAVAYPTDKPFDFYRRSYDFSPPVPKEVNDPPQGGQDEFVDFLKNILQPEIARRYDIHQERQSLYGHSFGGMFTLYAIYTQPTLFQHYIVSSPSLWWASRYLITHERTFMKQVKAGEVSLVDKSLYLLVAEGDDVQERQDIELLADRMKALSAYGFRSAYYLQEDEDHMSLPITIAHRVLRQAFNPRLR
ncbi:MULTISPECIES: alpha/beta hydrolase [unclassified Methylophaga]|jgi:hypothetical protein|uniref:alpha/beta hydrolase n=1 Tax=unclassified Methylophaga TaxID=2629249 RepID=UPI00259CF992|nr:MULTISPECIES: alpha/beta hydrolase-fold protein [unclassified Methylophaga]|tara:strand:+ start:4993 stop:5835 length:843 start_codon:yes stop_codon:yes gene_type:complete